VAVIVNMLASTIDDSKVGFLAASLPIPSTGLGRLLTHTNGR
jgi:hypothetical protein